MTMIRQLDPHVADLIAAGEVVERPASVVKELMENAIDAGATAVTVEIAHGGMTFIRVSDNGCGIPADQARTAFLRHATSKIATEYDLEAIGTLGFRGEALASIAAVSRVEVLTCTQEDSMGTALTMEAGVVTSQEEAGCPKGTAIVVRELFYNTPARLKFLKKDAAEGAAAYAVAQRIALSHPELSVKFIRDGKQELLTPGDGQLKSAVYAVMGRDIALGLVPVKGSGEGMSIRGFASLPACCRASRSWQHFFVNGRYVKSRVMMAALEEAYKNQRMVGRFPGCVIHLTVRPSEVDVNVHPTKMEVKFQKEQQVFSTIYYGVRSALEQDGTRPQAMVTAPREDTVTINQVGLPLHDPGLAGAVRETPAHPVCQKPWPGRLGEGEKVSFQRVVPLPRDGQECPAGRLEQKPRPAAVPPVEQDQKNEPAPQHDFASGVESEAESERMPWQVRGELFRTYVMVEQGDKVILIDKHAAHERVNFDRLKAADYRPMVQELLTPVTFTLAPEERETLLAQEGLLAKFGFEIEEFGAAALAVRSVPDYLDAGDIESALLELAGRLWVTGTADPAGARDELLHTMACKAAIKGGQRNGELELEQVARMVMTEGVKYCPHGRPVAIELTRKQLEKQFKRI